MIVLLLPVGHFTVYRDAQDEAVKEKRWEETSLEGS